MSGESFERVAEIPSAGSTPHWVHPGWQRRFPWLTQATSHRGDTEFDLRFFGGVQRAEAERRLALLASDVGLGRQVLSHQVHGGDVLAHSRCAEGLSVAPDADGHVTDEPGLLLAVTVADCVPVFIVAPASRAIALLHAGWRSAAADILEHGLQRMDSEHGVRAGDVFIHFGPSICEVCYEVGPEVFRALGQPEPGGPMPIDLRGVLARQAVDLGVQPSQISISTHCTRCGDTPFYSHRGGDAGRQLAILGIHASDPGESEVAG